MKKKLDLTTINFGEPGHPARVFKEVYIKRHGKGAFSKFIRKLLASLSYDDKEMMQKIKIQEWRAAAIRTAEAAHEKARIQQELADEGVDIDQIIAEMQN